MATERWIATTPSGDHIRLSHTAWTRKILISHPEFAADPGYEQQVRLALEDPEFVVVGVGRRAVELAVVPHGAQGTEIPVRGVSGG